MGTLAVTAPDGWRVQLDDNTGVLVPARLHAMPGVHLLAFQAQSGPIQHRDVTLELGKTSHVGLAAEPAAPAPAIAKPDASPAPAEPPLEPPRRANELDLRRSLGFAAAGAGVASVGAGIILGVSALSARDAYNATPTLVAYNHASGLQTWTDVAFVAGGVFLVGGAALVLWPSPNPRAEPVVSLAPSLGGAVVRGAF